MEHLKELMNEIEILQDEVSMIVKPDLSKIIDKINELVRAVNKLIDLYENGD